MGLTSAAYVAQRTTCAITHIHRSMGFWSINYLDDFGSAEYPEVAWNSYTTMGEILKSINIAEAEEKAVPPSTRMEFLGNTVDSAKMTIEVSPHRQEELMSLLLVLENKKICSKKELQSHFVTNCVRSGQLFLARMIDTMKNCDETNRTVVDEEMKKDVQWWIDFLPTFNGAAILWLLDMWEYDEQ